MIAGQPIAGATIKVWVANPTPNAAATLLGTSQSDANGDFRVVFVPPAEGQLVYLVVVGGDSGGGANSAIRLATVAGAYCAQSGCGFHSSVTINTLTSAAMAYSLNGYIDLVGGALNVSGPQSGPGLANAAITFATLVDAATGEAAVAGASATLCSGDAEPGNCPALRKLNTLANIAAACVLSAGANSSACKNLLATTNAADSFGALFNIADSALLRADGSGIFALAPTSGAVYAPALTHAPNDWAVALVYRGGGLQFSRHVAVDAQGNVWVSNYIPSNLGAPASGSMSKFAPDGRALSPAAGFTGGGLRGSIGIAIDQDGHVWVANWNGGDGNSISEFNSEGSAVATDGYAISGISPGPYAVAIAADGSVWVAGYGHSELFHFNASGELMARYQGGGLGVPVGIAIDALGNVWLANQGNSTVSEFSSVSEKWLSPPSGYSAGGLSSPDGIAIDLDGNVWVPNFFGPNYPGDGSAVTQLAGGSTPPATCPAQPRFGDTGCALSPAEGFVGGGLYAANVAAVDSAGHIFISNYHGNSLSEFDTADGSALSPADGYRNASISLPSGVAIDASGNVWLVSSNPARLLKFIGLAAPTRTPLVAALVKGYKP